MNQQLRVDDNNNNCSSSLSYKKRLEFAIEISHDNGGNLKTASSSNTSSSSNPSDSSHAKYVSSAYIPLNQSRIIYNPDEAIDYFDSKKQPPTLSSLSSSTSSVVASLSVLSFSASNSISSLSSSISYGDAAAAITNIESLNLHARPAFHYDEIKNFQKLNLSVDSLPLKSTANQETSAPYRGKSFYGKEWFFAKLNDYLVNKKLAETFSSSMSSSSGLSSCSSVWRLASPCCLVLLGDSGTGKTHLCCELKWPTTLNANTAVDQQPIRLINKQIVSVYFLSWLNPRQNSLRQLHMHLSKSIQEFVLGGSSGSSGCLFKEPIEFKRNDYFETELLSSSSSSVCNGGHANEANNYTENYVDELANDFVEGILKPLRKLSFVEADEQKSGESLQQLHEGMKSLNKNYFIIVDGIDDAILYAERLRPNFTESQAETECFPFRYDHRYLKKKNI